MTLKAMLENRLNMLNLQNQSGDLGRALHEYFQTCEPDEGGYRYVESSVFWPKGLSSTGLRDLILDERFDWLYLAISKDEKESKEMLLPHLIGTVPFEKHLDADPVIGEALRARYAPEQIASLLSTAQCIPSQIQLLGSGVDQRTILLERVAMIVLQDPLILDAWVTLTLQKIKERTGPVMKRIATGYESFHGMHGDDLTGLIGVTQAYADLELLPLKAGIAPNPSFMTLACALGFLAVFDPEGTKASLARYTPATMYQISDPQICGLIDMRGNLIHRAFIQGLYLNAPNSEAFARIHLGNAPLEAGDTTLCGALLACAPYTPKPHHSIRSLLKVERENVSALDALSKNHLFKWHPDLIDLIFSNPQVRSLRSKLVYPDSALRIFKQLMASDYPVRKELESARNLYVRLAKRTQKSVFELLSTRIARRSGAKDKETRGTILRVMATLCDATQAAAMRSQVLPTLPNLMKACTTQPGNGVPQRSLSDWQLLASLEDMHSHGVLTLDDIGLHLKTVKAVTLVAKTLAVDPAHLIACAPPFVQAECLEADLGL